MFLSRCKKVKGARHFRFLAPFYDILPDDIEPMLEKVRSELQPFVGQTAFEQLSQQWVREKRKAGNLAFRPLIIGSHWSRKVQIDVVGVNWASHDILLGACKWGGHQIGRGTLCELVEEKTTKVLAELPHSPLDTRHFTLTGRKEWRLDLIDMEN